MSRTRDLTRGSILKGILLFALPLMLSDLLQQLYSLMDSVVVGRFVGSDALAAIGTTASFCYLMIGFFMGLGGGGGVVISQFFGAGDKVLMRKAVHTSLVISLLGGLFLTVFGYCIAPTALRLIRVPAEIFDMACTYLRITFLGSVGLTVYNMGSGVLRAVGDSVRPLMYLAASSVLNVGLNLFFVLVLHMGVAGVALGTILAQFGSMALVLYHLFTTSNDYRVTLGELRLDKSMAGRILRIGVPAGLQYMMMDLANVLIQSTINSFGAVAIAGNTVCGKINGFCYLPLNAIGMAATTFTGQNVGAGKTDRVYRGAATALWAAVLASTGIGIIAAIFAYPLLGIVTTDLEVLDMAAYLLRIYGPSYGLYAAIAVFSGVIRGAGHSLPPMIITLVCLCLFRILWILVMTPIWNDMRVVAWVYPVSWTLGMLGQFSYYKFGPWRKNLVK